MSKQSEHICTGGTWNNKTKQFECGHGDEQSELGNIRKHLRMGLQDMYGTLAPSENLIDELIMPFILDWHNKQTEALLNEMLVDVSSPSARIDQAEMIELINLYINKLKESDE